MKYCCFNLRFLALLCLSAVVANAASPLANVKVISTKGTISYGAPGSEDIPLIENTILSEGDSIITGSSGVAHLVFSNGAGLTIEENTNLVFSKLKQKPYWKDNPEEYPKEEISNSTTELELKYGNLKGNVGGLRQDSEFRIKTKLGDVLVSGNSFFVGLYYDSIRQEFVFDVKNIDGKVDLVTKFSGPIELARNGTAKKSYDPEADALKLVRIPPGKTFSVQKSSLSPEFRNYVKQFPKDTTSRFASDDKFTQPYPNDQEVMVVSPNGTEGTEFTSSQ